MQKNRHTGQSASRRGHAKDMGDATLETEIVVPVEATAQGEPPSAIEDPAITDFVATLARALHRHQSYPFNSPLCEDDVREAHVALAAIASETTLVVQLSHHVLRVGGVPIQAGPVVATELAGRMRRLDISQITIDVAASPRDIAEFCRILIRKERSPRAGEAIPDELGRRGIDRIQVEVAPLRKVVEMHALDPDAVAEVERHRALSPGAREDRSVAVAHEAGFLRVKPGTGIDRVSLPELALLCHDPAEFAQVLVRLSGGSGSAQVQPEEALVEQFAEIASLYAQLHPDVSSLMLRRLAAAAAELEPGRRKLLLKNQVLPGLLDGKAHGDVLNHLPDDEIAASLTLLAELETAAPEIVRVALSKLKLSDERKEAVKANLLNRRGTQPTDQSADQAEKANRATVAENAGELIEVERGAEEDLSEYAAYDLSVTAETEKQLGALANEISSGEDLRVRLRCARSLLRVVVNPDTARRVLERMHVPAGAVLETEPDLLADWLESLRQTAVDVEPDAPEVAAEIHAELRSFCDQALLNRVVAASHDSAAGAAALRVLEALGPYAAEAVVAQLRGQTDRGARRELVELLCARADALAPSLVDQIGEDQEWYVTRNLICIIGHAGPGHEDFLVGYLGSDNDQLVKESLQALARTGTERALRAVVRLLDRGVLEHADLAEQTLWKFPSELVTTVVQEWLEVSENALTSPDLAVRMLTRLSGRPGFTISERVAKLSRYRLHFWAPSRRKLGATVARLGGSR
ncbi:MAG: hypothetical protein ABFS14_09620 [Gemmatimonadota bacterium]